MLYYIIKLSKGVSILYRQCKSTSESNITTGMQKNYYDLMKLDPCINCKIVLNLSDSTICMNFILKKEQSTLFQDQM